MMVLIRTLPFLIGSEEDDHWHCFLLLRKIVDIVLCPIANENPCSSLKLLIREHHDMFVRLYGPDKYIPKLHFILHYPDQILAIGPMVETWTIRQEAKLNFFKQASRLANFKNIALSLASRHQRWACYESASGKLVNTAVECGPPSSGNGLTLMKDEAEDIKSRLRGCNIQTHLGALLRYFIQKQ